MARLRDLSGDQVLDILLAFGYIIAAQDGRHLKLRKVSGRGQGTTMTFPLMKELDRLTLTTIYHEASQYVQQERLRLRFYEP